MMVKNWFHSILRKVQRIVSG